MAAEWRHAIEITEMPGNGVTECVVEGRIIALFKLEGEFRAIDGICPHQGGSLGKGSLHGCVVRCPWHGWEYDINSGQHQSIPTVCVNTFETRIVDNNIEVRLS
ncbi:MAG: ferredoxin [Planctomycetaceae bacterium]|nr:ferredoxin [Planctomycetaceae bacterium]